MPVSDHPIRLLTLSRPNAAKPLFIFLPGMDGTGRLFYNQVKPLAAHFDLRAVSIPTHDLTGWQALTEQVASLVRQQLSRSRPVYLCGESFGACLALKLAAHSPALYHRLILVNPASSYSRQPWMSWATQGARWLPNFLYPLSTLGLLPFLVAQDRVSTINRQALLKAMQSVAPQSAAWRLHLLSQFSLKKLPLHQITQPALVVASGADRLLPSQSEGDRLIKHLPNARKILLPQSGHACLLEKEVRLSSILQSQGFLEQVKETATL